jgi:hypothetical protein
MPNPVMLRQKNKKDDVSSAVVEIARHEGETITLRYS